MYGASVGDVLAEMGDLFADVTEESVRQPASDDHDGVGGDLHEVHRNGSSRAKQVGANHAWFEDEFILSHNKGGRAQCSGHDRAWKPTLTHSASDMRGHSGCCANTRWSKITSLNSEPGISAVPAWLLMASLR